MKIYVLALAILIFSGTVSIINEIGIFNSKMYEPGYTVNQSDVNSIYEIDSGKTVDSKQGWFDDIADTLGINFLFKIVNVIKKTIGLALNLGSLFTQYVPGTVGEQFAVLITAATWFIYAWGGVQLWRKVSSKGMD